nr:lytic murein transglycosylase [Patulibacter sp. SYSU D01012]
MQYGIRWEVLAAINEVETDYGRNLNVSSAGALGWMQFMPPTWAQYGVDANGDRDRDPYNPVDAIFAAARYLQAAGGERDLRRAIFAYNHADWYVDDVLERARAIAALPSDVVGSLTGLTLAQMPVFTPSEGRGGADERAKTDRPTGGRRADERAPGGAADDPAGADAEGDDAADEVRVRATASPDWSSIATPRGTKVVAVQDGTVVRMGRSDALGRFVELRDAYGNRYTYAHLDALAAEHVVPRRERGGKDEDGHGEAEHADHAGDGGATGAGDDARPGGEERRDGAGGDGASVRDGHGDADAAASSSAGSERAGRTDGQGRVAAAQAAAGRAAADAAAASVGPARPRSAAEAAEALPSAPAGAADDRALAGDAPAGPGTAAPADPGSTTGTPAPGSAGPATPGAGAAPGAGEAPAPTATSPAPAAPATTTATTPAPAAGTATTTVPAGTTTAATAPTPSPEAVVAGPSFLAALLAPVATATDQIAAVATAAAAQAQEQEQPDAPAPQPDDGRVDDGLERYVVRASALRPGDVRRRELRVGSRVLAGTVLGRTGATRMRFAIRPAGDGAPRIDARPIVAGWRLLDDAAVFGNDHESRLVADRADEPDVGRLLLMSKEQLQARVLANPRLAIYEAGRTDIRTGVIDRRVLATMEYLAANGLRLTISSLRSGHSLLSASGNVSAHSYGCAFDIAAVDGIPIVGHQGAGTITDRTIRLLLRLQGTMKPNQIISLMDYPRTDNTLVMADHADHVHVGFPRAAEADDARLGRQVAAVLQPGQWRELVSRLRAIENPTVRRATDDPRHRRRGAGE